MGVVKRLGKSEAASRVLADAMAVYIRLLNLTTRWRIVGLEEPAAMVERGEPFIGAFWHGRMVMLPGLWKRYAPEADLRMLISRHRDGRFIARTIARLGVSTISGSTTRGGVRALREIDEALAEKAYIGITPDGPRGPRMRVTPGVISAAQRSGVPIFAITWSATRRKLLGRWDRMVLPWPFARVVYIIKGPIPPPESADAETIETKRKLVEDILIRATREADRLCGQPLMEPEPADGRRRRKAGATKPRSGARP